MTLPGFYNFIVLAVPLPGIDELRSILYLRQVRAAAAATTAVAQRDECVRLVHQPAVNATVLLDQAETELSGQGLRCIRVHGPDTGSLSLRDFMRQVLGRASPDALSDHDLEAGMAALTRPGDGFGRVVLLVTQAHNLQPSVLRCIQLACRSTATLRVVLAGEHSLATALAQDEFATLRQRLTRTIDLTAPLDGAIPETLAETPDIAPNVAQVPAVRRRRGPRPVLLGGAASIVLLVAAAGWWHVAPSSAVPAHVDAPVGGDRPVARPAAAAPLQTVQPPVEAAPQANVDPPKPAASPEPPRVEAAGPPPGLAPGPDPRQALAAAPAPTHDAESFGPAVAADAVEPPGQPVGPTETEVPVSPDEPSDAASEAASPPAQEAASPPAQEAAPAAPAAPATVEAQAPPASPAPPEAPAPPSPAPPLRASPVIGNTLTALPHQPEAAAPVPAEGPRAARARPRTAVAVLSPQSADQRHCRQIVLYAQLGKNLSDADKQFLRDGCRTQ